MDRETTRPSPSLAELRGRAVQRVIDPLDSDASLTAAVWAIPDKPGCAPDSLRVRYRRAGHGAGKEARPTQVAKPSHAP